MREIKFRGFSESKKVWLYGDLLQTEIAFQKMYSILDWSHAKQNTKSSELNVPVESVGQLTGLKDKNGKEIYDQDFIKSSGGDIMLVVWRQDLASFALRKDGWMYDHYFGEAVDAGHTQVVGNFYENPELIKDIQRA
jgi:uncharacterized phage protein (TIGR01671 family)